MDGENKLIRPVIEGLAGLAIAAVWVMTYDAVLGRQPLPARIATHFDAAGNPNGWGEPRMLWLFPVVATAVYALMTMVARYPGSFNYPMRVTAAMRPRLEAITLNMIGWLKFEIVGLFAFIQWAIVRSAREGKSALSPAFLPIVLVVIFATISLHFAAMLRAGRG